MDLASLFGVIIAQHGTIYFDKTIPCQLFNFGDFAMRKIVQTCIPVLLRLHLLSLSLTLCSILLCKNRTTSARTPAKNIKIAFLNISTK
jgi:hypothetical protein